MENLIIRLRKIGDVINTVTRAVLGVFSLALCFAVIGQFVLRWVGLSMSWASDFSCYMFIWTTMLGSAVASRHLLHIGVDIIINCFRDRIKKAIVILADVVLLVALVLFIISGTQYTLGQISHMGTTVKVSLSIFYVSLPVCGVIMAYYTFVQLLETIYYGEAVKLPLPGDEEEEADE